MEAMRCVNKDSHLSAAFQKERHFFGNLIADGIAGTGMWSKNGDLHETSLRGRETSVGTT
jgi:hypothetical protein